MDPVVASLHGCLMDAIRERGEEPGSRPLKVSEIYRDLVPYREVRSTLGVELNADYEHALLRLLAGDGDVLRLEPDSARAELRREVESPYPFVGMYRKFAANLVYLTGPGTAAPGAAAGEARQEPGARPARTWPAAHEQAPVASYGKPPEHRDPSPSRAGGRTHALAAPAGGPTPSDEERRPATERVVATPAECGFCDQTLPVGRRIRFCPWCGSDQKLRPCPRCDEVLDRVWRFCSNCGLEVPALDAPRPPDPDE